MKTNLSDALLRRRPPLFPENLPLHLQLARLLAQLRELDPLFAGEAGLAVAAVRTSALDPGPQGRGRQVEITSDPTDRLALVQYEPNRPGLELVGETPPWPLLPFPLVHGRHRIRLSIGVHKTGSSSRGGWPTSSTSRAGGTRGAVTPFSTTNRRSTTNRCAWRRLDPRSRPGFYETASIP